LAAVVNDFNIKVATINGSGSQSANSVLMRSIFNMGVPVSGKNLFPSNIAGLATWFTIRASEKGYFARRRGVEIMVAMNPGTIDDDVREISPGTLLILNDAIRPRTPRDDIRTYEVPFGSLVSEISKEMRLRKLLVNMMYVGVVSELLGIETETIDAAIEKQFEGKKKAVELNKEAVRVGQRFVRENPLPNVGYRIERRNLTNGKIIVDGNAAAGLGAVFAGLSVLTWYPITPSSSLCEAAIGYLERFRKDKDGKATYAVVQAEDEIAAIGMVVGASWAGARAMTATSGPGISLMSEFAGLAYYAEVPAVIWDVQRVGPSTGLPTRTAQGDVLFVANLSHGDTEHIVLFPSNVHECFQMAGAAFDLAESFQTPVFALSDLDLGMNNWMSDPFPYPDQPLRRGKVLGDKDLEQVAEFARYKDVDGDGVPYRTLPGTRDPKAAFFTRGSGHDENAHYTESDEVYQRNLDRIRRKFVTAQNHVPQPIVDVREGADVGLISYGSTDFAVEEARDRLRADGLETSYLRVRALPLNDEVGRFIESHARVYVIEQNRDGQMANLIRLRVPGLADHQFKSVVSYDGLPMDATTITEGVLTGEKAERVEVK